VVIQKYRKDTGEQRLYAIGHSPKERQARSRNGRKAWNIPGFREKMSRIARKTVQRLPKDENYLESLRERMRQQSLEYWRDPEFKRMHQQMHEAKAKAARKRWADPAQRQAQADLMRRMSLAWWSDPDIRQARIAHLDAIRPDMSLENNPNWRDGRSFEPYPPEFNEELKAQIRARDGHACFICGLSEEEHHRSLAIHHIDYDKSNCDPTNLVTLCDTCHGKTSHNRKYWENKLRQVLQTRLQETGQVPGAAGRQGEPGEEVGGGAPKRPGEGGESCREKQDSPAGGSGDRTGPSGKIEKGT